MIEDRVAALDTQLFEFIPSSTTADDRKSLLAVHDCIASRGAFSYLEIGSHLGGSLQPVLMDPRCTRVVSIDPRPNAQPDDRRDLSEVVYEDNSTERMLENLRGVPGADLSKLETVEKSTEDLAPEAFAPPDFCFIDGEHTNRAALHDARFCRTVLRGTGVIAFHDSYAVERAILAFLHETPRPHRAYSLRSSVFVVELGIEQSLLKDARVRGQLYRLRRSVVANRVRGDAALLGMSMLRRKARHWRDSA